MSRLRIAFLMGMVAVFVLLLTSIFDARANGVNVHSDGTVSDTTALPFRTPRSIWKM